MKKIIRLTESELHELVKEAVNRILKEGNFGKGGNGIIKGDIFGTKLDARGRKQARELLKQHLEKEKVNEDGEIGGGGALGGSNLMVGSSDESGGIAYPAFAKKNKKKVGGNAFSEPIMRQKHNLGDVTNAPANQVDMKPALERGGSISMNRQK